MRKLHLSSATSLLAMLASACHLFGAVCSSPQYSIETRVIVDKWAMESWSSHIQDTLLDKDRTDQPESVITDYIKSQFVGANAIYEGLNANGIWLDIRIVSIEFIPDETIAPETQPGSREVDVDTILEQFEAWLSTKHYPRTDHVMLLTGLNMTNGTSEADPDGDPLGVAFVGKMCSERSLSAVQSIPNSKGAHVIAHELGHSLNASHDGDGNSCSNTSKNVMDAIVSKNTTKSYRFSSCSVAYLRDMLAALDRDNNCLAPRRTSAHKVQGVALGKLFTADQICNMTVGNHSRLCRGLYGYHTLPPYSSVCGAMWCQVTEDDCRDVFGTDGLTCGNHKVGSLQSK